MKSVFSFLSVILALSSMVHAAASDAVTAELVVDRASVTPGEAFRVGVRFGIAPTWHIYWRNPGDSGLPTAVELKLPDGYSAGEWQWPFPKEFIIEEIGDVNYGYEEEVLIFTTVTPPAGQGSSPVAIAAEVEWLACGETGVCVPGFADSSVELPIGNGQASESLTLFHKYSNRVPKRLEELEPFVSVTYSKGQIHVQPQPDWTGRINGRNNPPLLFPLEGPAWEYPRLKNMFNAVTMVPYFSFAPRDTKNPEKLPERLGFVAKVLLFDETSEEKTIRLEGEVDLK